jgi:hypothetical protein
MKHPEIARRWSAEYGSKVEKNKAAAERRAKMKPSSSDKETL